MKKLLTILLLVSTLGLIQSCDKKEQKSSTASDDSMTKNSATLEPYKIGVVSPFSGDLASYGIPVKKAVSIAVEKIKARGGAYK